MKIEVRGLVYTLAKVPGGVAVTYNGATRVARDMREALRLMGAACPGKRRTGTT